MINIDETIRWVEGEFADLLSDDYLYPWDLRAYEAVMTVLSTLEYSKLLTDKFGSLEDALDAEKVTRCERCYHYDPENLLCNRYGLEKPVLMIAQGYCSCGIDRETMEKIFEACRANGGWCTPGIIMTSEELKSIMDKEETCGTTN